MRTLHYSQTFACTSAEKNLGLVVGLARKERRAWSTETRVCSFVSLLLYIGPCMLWTMCFFFTHTLHTLTLIVSTWVQARKPVYAGLRKVIAAFAVT